MCCSFSVCFLLVFLHAGQGLTENSKDEQETDQDQELMDNLCFEQTTNGNINTLPCTTCTQELPCIDLCCPFGEALMETEGGEEECGVGPLNEDEFWTAPQMQGMVDSGSGQQLIFRAPAKSKKHFKCPKLLVPEWQHHYEEYNQESYRYKVDHDGRLIGTNVTYPYLFESRFGDTSWKNGDFCVAFADRKSTNSSDDDDFYEHDGFFQLVFGVCFSLADEPDNSFNINFHPYALGISVFFLILTVVIYVWFKGFNLKDLNSRIYVAFIVNLTVTYTTCLIIWIQADKEITETTLCQITGYLNLYFSLSTHFWISAMGFKTWRIFSGLRSETRRSNDSFTNERKTFLYFSIYAQGLPFLVCIATTIIDACREKKHDGNGFVATRHFPNMGVVGCFVGEMYDDRTTYLTSAKFLYHDMFMVVIQMFNLYFYASICVVLCKGWENQESIRRMKGDVEDFQERIARHKKHAVVCLRLFIILGEPFSEKK